jgi:hypothetical protein
MGRFRIKKKIQLLVISRNECLKATGKIIFALWLCKTENWIKIKPKPLRGSCNNSSKKLKVKISKYPNNRRE